MARFGHWNADSQKRAYTGGVFTGIISHIANVLNHVPADGGLVLTFERPRDWSDLVLGESIATEGVCLTVSALRDGEYDCFLMGETLSKTTFGGHVPERVNLERAMSSGERFGGHIVQGHVDGIGEVTGIDTAEGYVMKVKFGRGKAGLVMYKGSICINGVSLTVARVQGDELAVALIPHTLEYTTLSRLRAGDRVNLEFDVIGKYIANIMEARQAHAAD
jgi:riboflavin synthase